MSYIYIYIRPNFEKNEPTLVRATPVRPRMLGRTAQKRATVRPHMLGRTENIVRPRMRPSTVKKIFHYEIWFFCNFAH